MKKYIVDVYHEVNEDHWSEKKYEGNDPHIALEIWADLSRKYPTMVSINCYKREDACELIDHAYNNMDWFLGFCKKKRVPYKLEYLRDGIGAKYQTGCDTFHETKINGTYYPDQVYPFCLG